MLINISCVFNFFISFNFRGLWFNFLRFLCRAHWKWWRLFLNLLLIRLLWHFASISQKGRWSSFWRSCIWLFQFLLNLRLITLRWLLLILCLDWSCHVFVITSFLTLRQWAADRLICRLNDLIYLILSLRRIWSRSFHCLLRCIFNISFFDWLFFQTVFLIIYLLNQNLLNHHFY